MESSKVGNRAQCASVVGEALRGLAPALYELRRCCRVLLGLQETSQRPPPQGTPCSAQHPVWLLND